MAHGGRWLLDALPGAQKGWCHPAQVHLCHQGWGQSSWLSFLQWTVLLMSRIPLWERTIISRSFSPLQCSLSIPAIPDMGGGNTVSYLGHCNVKQTVYLQALIIHHFKFSPPTCSHTLQPLLLLIKSSTTMLCSPLSVAHRNMEQFQLEKNP